MQLTVKTPVDDMAGECRAERRQTAHLLGPRVKSLDQLPLQGLQMMGNK